MPICAVQRHITEINFDTGMHWVTSCLHYGAKGGDAAHIGIWGICFFCWG